jgi:hypothetical protein
VGELLKSGWLGLAMDAFKLLEMNSEFSTMDRENHN